MKLMKFDEYYDKDMMYMVDLEEFKKHAYHSNELILALFRNYREKITFFGCSDNDTEEFKLVFKDIPYHHNPVLLEKETGFNDSINNSWFKDFKITVLSKVTDYKHAYYVSDFINNVSRGAIDVYINGEKISFKR